MKIEKVNDHQIRCTLTKADLADRELKISELAYGTEKAKSLFRDMMQQAAIKFGFEADDIPLMIEAIPLNSDCIVLIITKVDDPTELDHKLSKFGPSIDPEHKKHLLEKLEGADELLDLINKVKDAVAETAASFSEKEQRASLPKVRLFSFSTLDSVLEACRLLQNNYSGANTLYKDVPNDVYILAMTQSDHSTADFNKFCNMLSEYGCIEKASGATLAFLEEHCEVLVADHAVQSLGWN